MRPDQLRDQHQRRRRSSSRWRRSTSKGTFLCSNASIPHGLRCGCREHGLLLLVECVGCRSEFWMGDLHSFRLRLLLAAARSLVVLFEDVQCVPVMVLHADCTKDGPYRTRGTAL